MVLHFLHENHLTLFIGNHHSFFLKKHLALFAEEIKEGWCFKFIYLINVVNDFKTRVYIGAFTSIFKYIHLGRGCTFCWRRQSGGNSILTLFRSLANQKTLIF